MEEQTGRRYSGHDTEKDDGELVGEDFTENQRVNDSPVTKEEGIRCYAGISREPSRGRVIGSCCVQERSCREAEPDRMRERSDETIRILAQAVGANGP